ncbi:hypothetical protein K469DRAFT_707868 [Zopfia rhizophila CBS 207.26]|uniref:Uncharacterized protein n=1 Tax=Zopfia rhizophila CBS 207.26 TaxID=1314779 RepID=A0A6A6E638_9PEZI|nr:hypothetical protein K469DRAFT_707868 [Zopfia rhizophila CBS 207.26]
MLSSWFFYVPMLQKICFSDLEKTLGRLDSESVEAMRMRFGWEKVKWAIALLCNPNGVGCNFEIRG